MKRVPRARARQSGYAVLLATVLLVTVMLTVYLGRFDGPALRRTKDDRTAQALAQAKEALIGYATSNQTLPGSLPCPDISNSGQAAGASGSNCAPATGPLYIGRLPWKTLGLGDVRDGDNECLWYAIAYQSVFRSVLGITLRTTPSTYLNTATLDPIPVQTKDANGNTRNSNVVAVIFAPGAPLGAQTRSPATTTQTCSGTSSVPADIGNYLEGSNATIPSATSVGVYDERPATTTFNDKIVVITQLELAAALANRVFIEIKGTSPIAVPTANPMPPYVGLTGYYDAASSLHTLPCAATIASSGYPGISHNGLFPYADPSLNIGNTPPPPVAPYTWLSSASWKTQIKYDITPTTGGCPVSGSATVQISLPNVVGSLPFTYQLRFP